MKAVGSEWPTTGPARAEPIGIPMKLRLIETANATGAALVVSTHDPEFASRLEHRWDMTDGCLRTDNVDQPRSVREEPCSV